MEGHLRPRPFLSDISPGPVPIRTFFVPVAHLPRTTTSPSRKTLLAAYLPVAAKSASMSRLAAPAALAADALSSPLVEAPSIPWDAHLQPTGMLYSPAARAAHTQTFAGLYTFAPSPSHSVSSIETRPPSPLAPANVLKSRVPSPAAGEEQNLCLPTHQVFDIPPGGYPIEQSPSPSPSPPPERQESQSRERLSISINPSLASSVPAKRASSTAPCASSSKKPRATTSTKDFVPPDVSGLSKREARLVKNRAAAFLSRQRKREEFENMEM